MPPARPSRARHSTRASAVVIKQVGLGPWRCDACRAPGAGGIALLEHAGLTGHLRYSPRAA